MGLFDLLPKRSVAETWNQASSCPIDLKFCTTYFHKLKKLMVRLGRNEQRGEDFLEWSTVEPPHRPSPILACSALKKEVSLYQSQTQYTPVSVKI